MLMDNKGCWTQGWGPEGPRAYNPIEPTAEMVDIEVIAHVLSQQCRFAGHTNKFFSVAQHCVIVSNMCEPQDALWGLLHDASEALIVDVPRPLKRQKGFEFYMECEAKIMMAVCDRYKLPYTMPLSVKLADDLALALEFRDLMYYPMKEIIADSIFEQDLSKFPTLQSMPPKLAQDVFLGMYDRLTR